MLSQSEAQSYEQQSIRRTLCCANCEESLQTSEVHICEKCCLVLLKSEKESPKNTGDKEEVI